MERTNEERFEQLFNQITEIAEGNFEFRYKPSARLDHIDTVGTHLNMLSEEIAYFNFESYANFLIRPAPVVLIFDSKGRLTNFSSCFWEILGYTPPPQGIEVSIDSFLTEYSIPLLTEELNSLTQELNPRIFPLDFNTADKRIFRSNCSLSLLIQEHRYALLIYEDFKHKNLKEFSGSQKTQRKSVRTRSARNWVLLKNLRMYSLRNLNKPLPSLKEIGLLHHTNATKIKAEFKKAFGMTIHQFHLQQRLKQAALLLQTTDLLVKEISKKCGFGSEAHFSRCFKKQYNQTPISYREC